MKKGVKIFLLALGGLLLLVILALVVVPVAFKPQILRLAKSQIASHVNADVDFDDLTISLWRGFPDLYVALDGVRVITRTPFEGDTLAAFDRFAVTVNLSTLLDPANMQVRSIQLVHPRAYAHRNALGQKNWDIAVPSTEDNTTETDSATTGEKSESMQKFCVALEELRISDGVLAYTDDSTRMAARAEGFNFTLRGNLGLERSELDIDLLIEKAFFSQGGIELAPGVRVAFVAGVDADLAAKRYTLRKNALSLNDFTIGFEGHIAMMGDSIATDMQFGTTSTDFKTLLSLVPALYRRDFQSLTVGGQMTLSGEAHGVEHGQELPNVGVKLRVENGMFRYPTLPKQVDGIELDVEAQYHGRHMDSSSVQLRRLDLRVAGNPIHVAGSLATPISDPSLQAEMSGRLDLGSLADVIPLEGKTLSGLLELDMSMAARKSYVEAKQYEACKLLGSLLLQRVNLDGVLRVPVQVEQLDVKFSPKEVRINTLRARAGRSDVALQGGVQDFLPYLLAKGTLRGDMQLESTLLDLNELFPPSADGDTVQQASPSADATAQASTPGADTAAVDLTALERINFLFRSHLGAVHLQNMELNNVVGNLRLEHSRLTFERISCETLGGSARIAGHFDYSRPTERTATIDADFSNIDVAKSVTTFSTLEKFLPTVKYITGNVSVRLNTALSLTPALAPKLNTVQATGELSSSRLQIVGSPLFTKLGELFRDKNVAEPTLSAMRAEFEIQDGTIRFKPFKTQIAGIPTGLEGTANLDQTIDFRFGMQIDRNKLGALNNAVGQLADRLGVGQALGQTIPVVVRASGPATNPNVSLDVDEAYKGQVRDVVKAKVDEVVTQVRDKAQEQFDKLMREAEEQGAKLVAEAERAADKLREEARTRADQLMQEAKKQGMLAELGAKPAAQKIVDEANKAADKLVAEARKQAEELKSRAKSEGDRLINTGK